MNGNLIIKNASELVTLSGFTARKGKAMSDPGIIPNGAVVVENGVITAVGDTGTLLPQYDLKDFMVIDAAEQAVLPGFIDAHTHFVFGGYRPEEFFVRLKGADYLEILAKGGGILDTVRATRQTSTEDLVRLGKKRLDRMLAFGVTTVEGKSGYGLDDDTEIKLLDVMAELDTRHPMDIVKTFLGAHAVPESYKGNADAFVTHLINDMLPRLAQRNLAEFCDVFCEKDIFSIHQSRRLLLKAKDLGFKIKLHADEIVSLGGAELAAELGAISADHLIKSSDSGISALSKKGVIAVVLPITSFLLKKPFARGRYMIDNGCALALATDMNPGSSFSHSIPLLIALAVVKMGLSAEEIIAALTINAAAALDRADTIGSIDPGKKGDLVILEYPSYKFLPYHAGVNIVEKTIKNGTVVFDRKTGA